MRELLGVVDGSGTARCTVSCRSTTQPSVRRGGWAGMTRPCSLSVDYHFSSGRLRRAPRDDDKRSAAARRRRGAGSRSVRPPPPLPLPRPPPLRRGGGDLIRRRADEVPTRQRRHAAAPASDRVPADDRCRALGPRRRRSVYGSGARAGGVSSCGIFVCRTLCGAMATL